MADELSEKQKLFVAEFLKDRNATQAAIRAGYSPRSARSQAADLLTNPNVESAIVAARTKREALCSIEGVQVIEELGLLATSDIGDVMETSPCGRYLYVRDLKQLTPAVRRCIKSIKQTTQEYIEGRGDDARKMEKVVLQIELHPKLGALELLMAHFGLNAPQKVEHSGEVTLRGARDALAGKLDELRDRVGTKPGGNASC